MSSIYNANSGELLTMAVAFSAALAQGQSQAQLAKLGAFFTIVGDTLNLYALQPNQQIVRPPPSALQITPDFLHSVYSCLIAFRP